jgi:broad specificity polyphosphatase/5'/3'-nucleotidase SurE
MMTASTRLGLRALYAALRGNATGRPVLAVAPATNARARPMPSPSIADLSGLVTARHEPDFFGFAIDGTPTDCTKLALNPP